MSPPKKVFRSNRWINFFIIFFACFSLFLFGAAARVEIKRTEREKPLASQTQPTQGSAISSKRPIIPSDFGTFMALFFGGSFNGCIAAWIYFSNKKFELKKSKRDHGTTFLGW